MVSRTEAIKRFLINASPTQSMDLAHLYSKEMECQVNVAQDNGTRVEGDYQGRKWHGWTDGLTTWKSFRVPYDAKSNPHYDDPPMNWDLGVHAEGIGMTGWNWFRKKSLWVAYDFDSIINHKAGISESKLSEVQAKACDIPWVTVRKSTSGKGIHLYVFVNEVDCVNHNEHAALGRAILSKMSAVTGFDFSAHVDCCGGNIWVWHRKQKDRKDGLALVKQGSVLCELPINWKDHVDVIKGTRKTVRTDLAGAGGETAEDEFEKLSGQHVRVELDEDHKKLLKYLEDRRVTAWWDTDHHMLVTHTFSLRDAHRELSLRGLFKTTSTGSSEHNCFCFPITKGGWVVRRFGHNVKEHPCWDTDIAGWTRCFLNRDADLATVSRVYEGIEDEKRGFKFINNGADCVQKACKALGFSIEIPDWIKNRDARMSIHKDGRLLIEITASDGDKANGLPGWLLDKKSWKRIFNAPLPTKELEIQNHDDLIRHIVTESGDDCGWVIKSDNMWRREPLSHAQKTLKSMGYNINESDTILGKSITTCWTKVNKPFQPEYPGNRQWNKDAAQFKYVPSNKDRESLHYPTWLKILEHCGKNLDEAVRETEWAKTNGIVSGTDYLKCWVASLFQFPLEPLPYLFFWGPQNCGKSVFHESLELLVTKGVARADAALLNPSGFNGELATAILCVIEEVDLGKAGTSAYNKIKDWVTARNLTIHQKYGTPFNIPNSTHWVQCANDVRACPIFSGDTRITVIGVNDLPADQIIPKRSLIEKLEAEASDFLRAILNLELPKSNDRLNVPVLMTNDKIESIELNKSPVELFCADKCHYAPGQIVEFSEFYDTFYSWLESDKKAMYSKIRVAREIPPPFVKGRSPRLASRVMVGNMSWTPPVSLNDIPLCVQNGTIGVKQNDGTFVPQ